MNRPLYCEGCGEAAALYTESTMGLAGGPCIYLCGPCSSLGANVVVGLSGTGAAPYSRQADQNPCGTVGAVTPAEAVLMDLLLERGYTREQAARALVALTLPEPTQTDMNHERKWVEKWGPRLGVTAPAELHLEAVRRGYLPKP